MDIEIPDIIVCVDCGQPAHRLTPPPEEGWEIGDFVAYRCSGCNDRWDMAVADPQETATETGSGFDFRQWLEDRNQEKGES